MTLVEGLRETAISKTSHLREEGVCDDVPFDTSFIFHMDMLLGGTGYAYGVIINKLVKNNNVFNIYLNVSENMFRLYYQMRSSEGSMSIHTDIYYQYCYLCYTMQAIRIQDQQAHLLFLLRVLTQFSEIVGEASVGILQLLFIDM